MPRKKQAKKEEGRKEKDKTLGKTINKKEYEKQAILIAVFMVFAVTIFVVLFFVYKNAGIFVYRGIKFKKSTLGDSRIPIYIGELFITRPDIQVKFNLYLRNEPQKLESIDVNFSDFVLRRYGYISFQPQVSGCYGSNYASYRIAEFLNALGMKVKGATTDPILSQDQDIEWRNCDDAKNLTIVVLQKSLTGKTTIEQQGNCYIINIASCEIIPAAEKFILETAINLRR